MPKTVVKGGVGKEGKTRPPKGGGWVYTRTKGGVPANYERREEFGLWGGANGHFNNGNEKKTYASGKG